MPGFVFESNRGTKHTFTAETSLGAEFACGWTGRKSKKFKSKVEAVKQKVYIQLTFADIADMVLILYLMF